MSQTLFHIAFNIACGLILALIIWKIIKKFLRLGLFMAIVCIGGIYYLNQHNETPPVVKKSTAKINKIISS